MFERSAEQAGFFEHGKNKLVMPGVASGSHHRKGDEIKPPGAAAVVMVMVVAFQMTYGQEEEIEIKKESANM